ncbi:biotin transporter BioY [Enterococcus dongliensis]|uniref:biotin transporter BioY n=1 Tax=Enterococcus dongliensis TaxID=2559925 RepID=UPI002890D40C|nr:biotin transporter BioY [Enterococcus dongliensis]MDT2640487.1 biotin transporter BioY [Enterococcus dongliensis]
MKLSSREIVLAGLFAAVISILAQFTIPLGPIPLTLQTFAVGFVVTILGKKTGTIAVLIYLLMGMIGLPVLAGGAAGIAHYFGPTGGFLIGFIFQAYFTALIIEKTQFNYFWSIVANITGAFITLLFGSLWLKFSGDLPWNTAFSAGMIPFILPGIIKALAAGYLGVLLGKRLPITTYAAH